MEEQDNLRPHGPPSAAALPARAAELVLAAVIVPTAFVAVGGVVDDGSGDWAWNG